MKLRLEEDRTPFQQFDKYTYTKGDNIVGVWAVEYENKERFRYTILCQGTWQAVERYMRGEMGHMGRSHKLSEQEVDIAKKIGIKVYIAPED